jgi:hypothetical protein
MRGAADEPVLSNARGNKVKLDVITEIIFFTNR